ncbi:hypothetical protein D3C71_1476200 [compost metagenome]
MVSMAERTTGPGCRTKPPRSIYAAPTMEFRALERSSAHALRSLSSSRSALSIPDAQIAEQWAKSALIFSRSALCSASKLSAILSASRLI